MHAENTRPEDDSPEPTPGFEPRTPSQRVMRHWLSRALRQPLVAAFRGASSVPVAGECVREETSAEHVRPVISTVEEVLAELEPVLRKPVELPLP